MELSKHVAARATTIRLLQFSIAAALVFPAILFAGVAYLNHQHFNTLADERIGRSLDVLQEQALKVFQSIDATLAAVDEFVSGRTNEQLAADAVNLAPKLKQLVLAVPDVQSIWIFNEEGRAVVSTLFDPTPEADFSSRDFFASHLHGGMSRYIGGVRTSPYNGLPFFPVSRARHLPDGSFAGVIEISVLPGDIHRFYSRLVPGVGVQYAMLRDDGTVLVRYPEAKQVATRLSDRSGFARAIAANPDGGMFTVTSEIDGIERRFGVRKTPGFPIYLSAGIETSMIRREWMASTASNLIFGVPATLLLAGSLFNILLRTKRLHAEEDRRDELEGTLRQAQKMEAIGQLSGGVAHDFNNLLTIIMGNLDSAQRLLASPSKNSNARLERALKNAMTGADRAATLTQRLLAFSRRAPHKPERIDATALINGLTDFMKRSLGEKVAFEFSGAADLWPCEVDRSEFEAALINLAVNARDAMPDGGTLTVKTSNAYLDDAYCRRHTDVTPGQYVLVCVADSGTGMSDATAQRALEPFFTTKPPGQGTGLGLSQVYGFVKQSGGHLKLHSEEGKGTTVRIYLPRYTGNEQAEPAAPQSMASEGNGEVVLVVEDDADVRSYIVETLRALNYRVRHAESAERALETVGTLPLDLLLTDVVLPGMNGRQLANAVTARQPKAKVVFMSGYSRDAIVHQGRLETGIEMLQKPLTSVDLSIKIRQVLATQI